MEFRPRIVLVKSTDLLRTAFRQAIEAGTGWTDIYDAPDAPSAVQLIVERKPDIVIAEHSALLDGLALSRWVHQSLPETQVLIVAIGWSAKVIEAVRKAGGYSYVFHFDGDKHLVHLLKHMTTEASRKDPIKVYKMGLGFGGSAIPVDPPRHLGRRNIEILRRLAAGKSHRDMAIEFACSLDLIELKVAYLMKRFQVDSVPQLIRRATDEGVLKLNTRDPS